MLRWMLNQQFPRWNIWNIQYTIRFQARLYLHCGGNKLFLNIYIYTWIYYTRSMQCLLWCSMSAGIRKHLISIECNQNVNNDRISLTKTVISTRRHWFVVVKEINNQCYYHGLIYSWKLTFAHNLLHIHSHIDLFVFNLVTNYTNNLIISFVRVSSHNKKLWLKYSNVW